MGISPAMYEGTRNDLFCHGLPHDHDVWGVSWWLFVWGKLLPSLAEHVEVVPQHLLNAYEWPQGGSDLMDLHEDWTPWTPWTPPGGGKMALLRGDPILHFAGCSAAAWQSGSWFVGWKRWHGIRKSDWKRFERWTILNCHVLRRDSISLLERCGKIEKS